MKGNTHLFAMIVTFFACKAQIPGLGWCPSKQGMPEFEIDKYLGTWYEAERYFTVREATSRCATTIFKRSSDGKILVSNEQTNRLTGIRRALDGEVLNVSKDSKISVKYSTFPLQLETTYIILDTDYDNYAVVWSCSGVGLLNRQSAWLMTRERLPAGAILQKAYGVLDKHKISKNFLVQANQENCYSEATPDNHVTIGELEVHGPTYEPYKIKSDDLQKPQAAKPSSSPVTASRDVDLT